MNIINNKILAGAVIVGLLVVATIFAFYVKDRAALGSVASFNEYQSTTTPGQLINASTTVIFTGNGAFGSVVITTAATGIGKMYFYDGTTTDATLRAIPATTTLAVIDAAAAAGTYTFDSIIRRGLIFEYKGVGTLASSTITFKDYE